MEELEEPITLAIIRSLVHARVENLVLLPEEGFYEVEVTALPSQLRESGSPAEFCKKLIVDHLVVCARSTKVPMYENLWYVQFSPWAQIHLNMPKEFLV